MLLAAVAALSILTRPDVEQISLTSPSLAALAKLTGVAHRGVIGRGDNGNSAIVDLREDVQLQIRLLEDLSKLPNVTGARPLG